MKKSLTIIVIGLIIVLSQNIASAQNGKEFSFNKKERFEIELPSKLEKDHEWVLCNTSRRIKVLDHSEEESKGLEIYELKCSKPGTYKVTFYYVDPTKSIADTATAEKKSGTITIKETKKKK